MIDQFSQTIELLASENGGSYIEALIDFAHKNHIEEFEELVDLLHPIVKDKVKTEFISKNYFPDRKVEGKLDEFFND